MLATIEGTYENGKVELAEQPAGVQKARVLVTFLTEEPQPEDRRPLALLGAWRDKIPDDVDIDALLREIRGEWTKEWENEASG